MFLWFAYVINIMLVFLTNKALFSAIFQIFDFLTQITENYAIFVICTKNYLLNLIDKYADLNWRSLSFYWFFEYYVIMTL